MHKEEVHKQLKHGKNIIVLEYKTRYHNDSYLLLPGKKKLKFWNFIWIITLTLK